MSLKILLIERDATTADLLVPSLERKGYQVQVARSQRQALSRIRALGPDLLVLDLVSFGNNGYKVWDVVHNRLSAVPAILLLEQEPPVAGDETIMTPPFTSRKLLYRVKKLAEGLTQREIRAGLLTLEPDSGILHKGEEILRLRPKEAALLALFMRSPGKVLSRQEIIKQVWETDYVGDTRTLSVHVRWLRLKIEEDPDRPRFLRTVRGIGYRFQVPDSVPAGKDLA